MTYRHEEVLAYWDDPAVESMYDKLLLAQEIDLIRAHLVPGARVLDVGCGEAEGTREYARMPGVHIVGADFSATRLAKAAENLRGLTNVELHKVDFVQGAPFGPVFDALISQRFLINLTDWGLQQRVLLGLLGCLRPGGLLLLLEGSCAGVRELNALRELLGLSSIPVKWHNLFFEDDDLVAFLRAAGCDLLSYEGLGAYFVLTRAIRPMLDRGPLDWGADFNRRAASPRLAELLQLGARCSRLKLWVFRSPAAADQRRFRRAAGSGGTGTGLRAARR